MSTGTLAPYWMEQFFDDDGNPLSFGKIFTYEAGTSTPATTWQTSDITSGATNSNPIVLDIAGRVPTAIYLASASYKFILTDSTGDVMDPIKSQDGIGSVATAASGIINVFTFFGDPTSPVTSTNYPSGATYDTCHAGTAIWALDSDDLAPGSYEFTAMMLSSGGTVTAAIVSLTSAPDTALATATSTSLTGESVTSGVITFAAGGLVNNYGIKTKVSSGSGFVWSIQVVKVA